MTNQACSQIAIKQAATENQNAQQYDYMIPWLEARSNVPSNFLMELLMDFISWSWTSNRFINSEKYLLSEKWKRLWYVKIITN